MQTLTLEGRDIAEQLYGLLRALDRVPSDEHLPTLRERAEALRARCARLLAEHQTRDRTTKALTRSLRNVSHTLDELSTRLGRGESASAAFTRFRRNAGPRYEAFVTRLRALRVEAPSLRPKNHLRSLFHVASALVAVVCIELLPAWWHVQLVAALFFAFAWTLEIGRRYSDALRGLSMRLFGRMVHPHEHVQVNSATWYATALLPISLLFPPVACMLGVVALGFGDPLAAYVGRRWGRTRLRAARSLEGTLAFAGAAFLASMALLLVAHGDLTLGTKVLLAGIGAVVGAIAELFSGRIDDNFSIPVTVTAACSLALAALS